jgi:hypothetical protein
MATPAMNFGGQSGWGGGAGANPTPWLGNEFVSTSAGGSNQYMNFPSMTPPGYASPLTNTPGVVPQPSSGGGTSTNSLTGPGGLQGPTNAPGMTGIGKGLYAQNPLDPGLTSQLFQYLQSQVGQGMTPFNLSALLPSSGQATQPGQLTAPLTQLLQQLQQDYSSTGQIGQMAQNGVSATPMWQQMVDAQQQNIQQNQANLQEQFNKFGNLASSPSAIGMANYQEQTAKDQNALLGQLQFQGIQDQLQAGQQVGGLGQMLQGLDQSAIQNLLTEFQRTQSQNNPTLGMQYGASTTFPPVVKPTSGGGVLGGVMSGLGQAAEIAAMFA